MTTSDDERNKRRQQLLETLKILDILDFSRPLIVVSEEAVRTGKIPNPPPISQEILTAAGSPKELPQIWYIRSLEMFRLLNIVISPEEEVKFERGEPLLFRANVFGLRDGQLSGGQSTDDLEKQIINAFAVNVFTIFERLQYLVLLRDGKNVRNWADQEAAQDFIFDKELLSLPWPESDFRRTHKRRRGLIDTAYRNGQRTKLLPALFPSQSLRKEIQVWAEGFRGKRKAIEEEIRFLKTQFVTLNLCRERAREFRRTENNLCKSMRAEPDKDWTPDPKKMEIAMGENHPIRNAGMVCPAVYAGDFDPRLIFHRLASVQHFDFIRELGRGTRGQSTNLAPEQIVEQITGSRQHLESRHDLFNERLYPELMSGREFLLHAYASYEDALQRERKPDPVE